MLLLKCADVFEGDDDDVLLPLSHVGAVKRRRLLLELLHLQAANVKGNARDKFKELNTVSLCSRHGCGCSMFNIMLPERNMENTDAFKSQLSLT